MKENKFVEKAYGWMEKTAATDCYTPGNFTISHAHIFGHVLNYLGNLRGNENKREVAKGIKKVVESVASKYLEGSTKTEILEVEKDFQELVNDIMT